MKFNKIAIAIGLLSIYGVSNAAYTVKFPLEYNSINIIDQSDNNGGTPTEPEVPVEEKPLAEMTTVHAPTEVFINHPFEMAISGINASKYKIRSNSNASGITTNGVEFTNTSNYEITPTQPGSYEYSVTAINEDGKESSSINVSVQVEGLPTVSDIKVNNTENFLHTAKGSSLSLSANVSNGSHLVENVPDNATTDPGEYTYTIYSEKTLNGVTEKSVTHNFVVATGTMFKMTIGRYNNGTNDLAGYMDTTKFPTYTTNAVGSLSIDNIDQNKILHVYQSVNGGSVMFGFDPNSPNGFFAGGKIWLQNVLCGQTTTSYTSTVDTYLFAGCSLRIGPNIGQEIKIYY